MLNKNQQEVVDHIDGPLMVLAGAGSGKTKALTHRIANLTSKGIHSNQILAITFTNKAAKEMKERVLLLDPENQSFIATFHRFCLFILRKEYESVNLKRNFSIYDDSESKAIIKSLLSQEYEKNPYIKNDPSYSVNNIKNFIAEIQHKGILSPDEKYHYESEEFYPIYLNYEKELLRSNAVDFNNIINKVLFLFKNENIRKIYTSQYKFLLIDEYQDTNKAQFQLLNFFSKDHQNICVIGDEDQSIYSFRGADINNILDFENLFSDTKVIKLEKNYRSTNHILNSANAVVNNNIHRKGKKLYTDKTNGELVLMKDFYSDYEEADFVVESIFQKISSGVNPKEIAIMFRNNSHSRHFEEKLRQFNIGYNFSGGTKFFDRKEIKDAIAYLRIISNPEDNYSLSRIINTPSRGLGKKSQSLMMQESVLKSKSLWDSILSIKLTKKARTNMENFVNLIDKCKKENKVGNLSYIFDLIMEETGYEEILEKSQDYTDQARFENLGEFRNLLREQDRDMVSLSDFLENITVDQTEENEDERINLLTIHASKGLEFDHVFVVGIEEGIFPAKSSFMKEDKIGIEEERRLFYVAITRARIFLSLSHVASRFMYGRKERMMPSRFLREIPNTEISFD